MYLVAYLLGFLLLFGNQWCSFCRCFHVVVWMLECLIQNSDYAQEVSEQIFPANQDLTCQAAQSMRWHLTTCTRKERQRIQCTALEPWQEDEIDQHFEGFRQEPQHQTSSLHETFWGCRRGWNIWSCFHCEWQSRGRFSSCRFQGM